MLAATKKVRNPFQDRSHVKLIYFAPKMTDIIQPLDASYIACLKSIYKKWLNREIYNGAIPDRLSKMTKISEISANLRPQIGKFCWRKTLYPEGLEEVVPEEVHAAAQEVEEENLQKVVHGLDQLFIVEEDPIGDEQGSKNEGLNADDDVEWLSWSKFPRMYPRNRRFNSRSAIIFLLYEK